MPLLKRAVWYITCGGGGAPYYAEEPTPWNTWWRRRKQTREGYAFSSQENVIIFRTSEDGVSMRTVTPHGSVIDRWDDLTKYTKGDPWRKLAE